LDRYTLANPWINSSFDGAADMVHPGEKAGERMNEERMMKWFEFADLPENLRVTASFFWDAACQLTATIDPGPERTTALRKLLESKDAAIRAKLNPGG
jgi:hypothetical protein